MQFTCLNILFDDIAVFVSCQGKYVAAAFALLGSGLNCVHDMITMKCATLVRSSSSVFKMPGNELG